MWVRFFCRPRQPLHSDTGLSLAGVGETGDSCIGGGLLTLFVALQDVEADMGGTMVLLGTNRSSRAHAALCADEDGRGMLADQCQWPQLTFEGSVGDAMRATEPSGARGLARSAFGPQASTSTTFRTPVPLARWKSNRSD